MVRPHLEYGNVVWGPHFKLDQQAIERVQKRATKLIRNIKDLPYSERLKDLNLPSLSYSRRRGDMLQTYKIISGKVNIDKKIYFSNSALQQHEDTDIKFISSEQQNFRKYKVFQIEL